MTSRRLMAGLVCCSAVIAVISMLPITRIAHGLFVSACLILGGTIIVSIWIAFETSGVPSFRWLEFRFTPSMRRFIAFGAVLFAIGCVRWLWIADSHVNVSGRGCVAHDTGAPPRPSEPAACRSKQLALSQVVGSFSLLAGLMFMSTTDPDELLLTSD